MSDRLRLADQHIAIISTRSEERRDSSGAGAASALFAQAIRLINDQLCLSFTPNIELCQALILAASYLAYVARPLHSWRYAQSAFSAFQQIQGESSVGSTWYYDDAMRRIYWSCFLLECDRAAELDLPRSGIETMADSVPLPSILAQDDYVTTAFLAEISIRRLLNRIHSSLYSRQQGLQSVGIFQLQKVATELDRQLSNWYESIPDAVRPALGTEALPNDRQRVLRIRFYAALHIIHRPSLLCIAENPETNFSGTPTLESAERCVEACRIYLINSTEMIARTTPYVWTFSASSLGALFILSVARTVPSLRSRVADLPRLQTRFLDGVSPSSTAGSSLEAMMNMMETIVAKEKHL